MSGQKVPPFRKLKEGRDEPILEPDLPIIDSHHHLFDRAHLRYMVDDYLEDARLGHNIVATVYVETQAMVRTWGPETLRPVGEVEFANGVGAMCASGSCGPCRVAAAIVGFADMLLGDGVAETLDASMQAAPGRFRAVRQIAISHPNPEALRFLTHQPPQGLLQSDAFLAAFRHIGSRGLVFDTCVLHHQLPELSELAARHPGTPIVLNHAGPAMRRLEKDPARREGIFHDWRRNMAELARNPNVFCKIGGLGTSYWDFGFTEREDPVGYLELATAWRPFVEAAVEVFGPDRCMAESNFPNDGRSCGFVPLWNALKHILKDHSADEKRAIFSGTARSVYRMQLGELAVGT